MRYKKNNGYTLLELMLVVAVMGVILLAAPRLMSNIYQFVQLSIARVEIQKNARTVLANMNDSLRQAKASTIVIDQVSGQPPHSRITFTKYKSDGTSGVISFYQQGTKLYMNLEGASSGRKIADNLRYIAFNYPRTDDPGILSVSITFEKATYSSGTKALQMTVEKVRIMN